MSCIYRLVQRALCFLLLIAIPIASPLWAADPAPSPGNTSSTAAASSTLTLSEVVVTAQRRRQNIYDVPISMAAYTNSDLLRRNISSLTGMAAQTPGISYRDFGATSFIAIRGITQDAGGGVAGVGPNTVAVYINNVPIQTRYGTAAVSGANPLVFDIARIEVLRGPQGTLFGTSAEGGAIRLITRKPSLTHYSGYAVGGFSDILGGGGRGSQFGIAYGGPINTGTLGVRASAWTQRTPGYIDNQSAIFGGVDQSNVNRTTSYVLQGSVLWRPSALFSALFRMYYQRMNQNSSNLFQPPTPMNPVGAGNPSAGDFVSTRALLQPRIDNIAAPSLDLQFNFGWSQLKVLTSYLHRYAPRTYDYTAVIPPALGLPIPTTMDYAEPTIVGTRQNNFIEEVRLQSPDRGQKFTWLVGLYYADIRQHDWETIQSPGLPAQFLIYKGETMQQRFGGGLVSGDGVTNAMLVNDQLMRDQERAVYAHIQYNFLKHFAVLAGFRHEIDGERLYLVKKGPLAGGLHESYFPSRTSATVPQFGLNWKPNSNNLVYFSASEGFRPGGGEAPITTPTAGCQAEVARLGDPTGYKGDTLWSYELGDKSRALGGRLLIAGSVYHIVWDNIISAIELPLCATHTAYNLGVAKSDGFDLSLHMLASEHWRLGLSMGYTDARYTSTTAIFGAVVSQAGNAISDVPPWQIVADAQYQRPIKSDKEWYVYVQNQYNSRNNRQTPAQDPATESYDVGIVRNPAYDVLLARTGLRFANGLDASIYVNNLLNEHPLLNWNRDLIDITTGAFSIQPRTIGAQFTYHF